MSSPCNSPTPSHNISVKSNASTPPPQSAQDDASSQKTTSFSDRWTAVTQNSDAKWNGLCATLQAMRYMYIAPEPSDVSFVPEPIEWDAVHGKITQHRDRYERTLRGTEEHGTTPTVGYSAFTELKRDFRSLHKSLVGEMDEGELSCLDRRDWTNRGHNGISDLADAARKMIGGVEEDYGVMEGVLREFGCFVEGA